MPNASQILQDRLANDAGFKGRIAQALAEYATGLLNPPAATTGNTTATSKQVTNIPSTAGMYIGQELTAAGVVAGTTITNVDSATQVTLSEAAQQTLVGTAITIKKTPNTTVESYARLVRDNAASYAQQWARYMAGSTNVIATILIDAEQLGEILVKSTATDASILSQVITAFKAFANAT